MFLAMMIHPPSANAEQAETDKQAGSSEQTNENQTILSVHCSCLLLQQQHRILGCSVSARALICACGGAVASRRPRTPLDIAKSFASGSARRSQNASPSTFPCPIVDATNDLSGLNTPLEHPVAATDHQHPATSSQTSQH
ncbi:hypothetical protein Tsp_02968 [Trichinella spiralis]|uniref:hypothetical protein n=1 Tax=Trichinella spiralis TaxID=6334 RepID=UPI0001EFB1F3|nr:hypothetical protein Tsp_02968 [Trichinella spiralis]